MRTVAVYPGRFHVFHRGHQAVYDHLVNELGADNVYIATSTKQNDSDSPFSYEDKVEMMTKMGVPPSRIVQVSNPYKIDEIAKTLGLDTAQDQLIYALGAKDAERFKYTPDSALQLRSSAKKMKPVGKHAYVEVVPTATFNVLGKAVQSASDIRKMYLDGNENDRQQIIADLYGVADAGLKDIFDQRLGVNAPQEGIIYGQEKVFAGDNPVSVMRERREKLMAKITEMREQLARFRQLQLNEQIEEDPDYIEEKWSQKYKRSINCSNPRGFSQKAHCAGRKKK
jgi:phosphopantetheine adenylyltransferase